MQNRWVVWFIVVGILITILIAFNYEGGRRAVPLQEIFPEEKAQPVEYEFFEADNKLASMVDEVQQKQIAEPTVAKQIPAVPARVSPAPSVPAAAPRPAVASSAATSSVASQPSAPASAVKVFTVQVASFKDEDRAQKALTQIKEKGYSAYIDPKSRKEGGFWYQICVGKFNVKQEADALLNKIKQDYKDSFIKVLQNH